jgi:hypothetical protein
MLVTSNVRNWRASAVGIRSEVAPDNAPKLPLTEKIHAGAAGDLKFRNVHWLRDSEATASIHSATSGVLRHGSNVNWLGRVPELCLGLLVNRSQRNRNPKESAAFVGTGQNALLQTEMAPTRGAISLTWDLQVVRLKVRLRQNAGNFAPPILTGRPVRLRK